MPVAFKFWVAALGLGLSRCFGRCIVIGMLTGIIAFVDLVVVVILESYVKCMVSKDFLPRQLHSTAVRRDDDQGTKEELGSEV